MEKNNYMKKELWKLCEWACRSWSTLYGLGLELGLSNHELHDIESSGKSLRYMLSEMMNLSYTKNPEMFFSKLYNGMTSQDMEGIYTRYILKNNLTDPFLNHAEYKGDDTVFDDDMQTCRILLQMAQCLTSSHLLTPLLLIHFNLENFKEVNNKVERLYKILIAGYNKFPYKQFYKLVKKCVIETELVRDYNLNLSKLINMKKEVHDMWVIESEDNKWVVEKSVEKSLCEEFDIVNMDSR